MLHGENAEWHNARRTICSGINGTRNGRRDNATGPICKLCSCRSAEFPPSFVSTFSSSRDIATHDKKIRVFDLHDLNRDIEYYI